jgi:hypothetical protein
MKNASPSGLRQSGRAVLFAVMVAALTLSSGSYACQPGEEACPAVLHMKPGLNSIVAIGEVSAKKPRYYFKFKANTGQEVTIRTSGGGLKTGAGFPLTFPDGNGDAIMEGEPYKLTQSGGYVVALMANLMSEGPFGRFKMTLQIK